MIQSRTVVRLLTAIVAAIAGLALLAPAAPATEPAPGYTQFDGCPDPEESPGTPICLRSDVTGGHLQMGSKDVPIKTPLTLSGAVNESFEGFTASPKGGLLPAKQEVPGGVIGITGLDWLVNFLSLEGLKLYAVAELTGPPTNFTLTSVTLPIRVHLVNPVLGNNCYIGTVSNPIVLNLTTETTNPPAPNKPITGKAPEISAEEEPVITHFSNGTYVDNSFAAPGASGCVLKLLGFLPISLNGLVNAQAGLPAAAGTNEVVQEFDIELAPQAFVYP